MTLQTLEYFIAVAQYRNFTKAAEGCHMTQPALSRAIQSLEEELGCSLFIRSGRTATLTVAGEVCFAEAQQILRQCDELRMRVWEAERQNRRTLRIGYLIISHLNAFMQRLSENAAEDIPFNLETVYGTNVETKRRFLTGEVEAIILPEPCADDLGDVEWAYIQKSQLYGIVHRSNPLYGKETLHLNDLRDQTFVMWRKENLPILRREHIQIMREAGFEPRIVAEGEKMGDVLAQATLHNAVGLAAKSSEGAYPGDCRFIRIVDSPERFGTICVWKRREVTPQLAWLRQALSEENHEK